MLWLVLQLESALCRERKETLDQLLDEVDLLLHMLGLVKRCLLKVLGTGRIEKHPRIIHSI